MPTLPPGTRIGPYEVIGAIGAGGMGEVVRARDVSLHREVALKILPAELASDEESRMRLAREARVLASLNHPHIAQVFGLEYSDAGPAIAMELVAGVTLRDRLHSGIARGEALRLAQQIALALDAAHEKGIVHRDLKPGNVMVTPEGIAKVLDFGLAKASAGDTAHDHQTTLAATVEGSVVGTPAYMSPEQARGQAVDRRTDIWAFGCILFEMMSGRAPFAGATYPELSAAILEREPDWRDLPETPAHLRRLIQRCLEKDRRARLRDIGDALHELSAPAGTADAVPPAGARQAASRPGVGVVLVVAGLIVGAIVTWLALGDRTLEVTPAASVRLTLPPPPGARFGGAMSSLEATTVAVAPDGQTVAFIASRLGEAPRVWLRPLAGDTARDLPGTDYAISVFWSPDGRSLAFFAAGQLKRMEIAGGAPVKVCDVQVGTGLSGSWGRNGDILFATVHGPRIWRVPAGGGAPVDALVPSDGIRSLWPRHLPDGRRFLYTEGLSSISGQIMLAEPDGRRTPLVQAASQAQWVDPDWLLFVREGTLLAQRVDLDARRMVGEPVSVLGSVTYSSATGWSNVAASPTGTIVAQWQLDQSRVAWFDAAGREMTSIGSPATYFTLRLAPDDGSLLFARLRPELGTYDIWRTDLARLSEQPVTTSPAMETGEAWVPGGRAVVYTSAKDGPPNLHHKDLITGVERRLTTMTRFHFPNDVTADGTQVIYQDRTGAASWDLMAISIADPKEPTPLFASAADETGARVAPGGTQLSFASTESDRQQVYVSPFPVTGAKTQVSRAGGNNARWRRDGRELYFLSRDRMLMAAPIDAAGVPGPPRTLFDVRAWLDYDVARDGRFIAIVSQVVGAEKPLAVILNWRK